MLRNACAILVAASLLTGAALSDEGHTVRHKPSRDPELTFVGGPAAAEEPALRTWLHTHESASRQLRLPVRLPNTGGGHREGQVGTVGVGIVDTALGVALADHVRTACGGAAECQLWLEGYWSGTQLDVRKVGPVVSEPSPRVGVQADRRIGEAVNAKAGAALRTDTHEVIYLERLAAWPASVLGRQVDVSGILVVRKLIPDDAVGAGGAISAGAPGPQAVFESPSWAIVE